MANFVDVLMRGMREAEESARNSIVAQDGGFVMQMKRRLQDAVEFKSLF